MLRRRVPETTAPSQDPQEAKRPAAMLPIRDGAADALLPEAVEAPPPSSAILPSNAVGPGAATMTMDKRSAWMVFAVASGTCAAFNGVFAKLYVARVREAKQIESAGLIVGGLRTTTELTTSIAAAIAGFLHLGEENHVVEYLIRAVCPPLSLDLPYFEPLKHTISFESLR